jgi:NADH:ubiquinone reductase (non-electrogenic)
MPFVAKQANRRRVVIVGSGWAGATISTALDEQKYKITVVSPEETTPYTPLLASAACGLYDFRYATYLPVVIESFWSSASDS